MVIYEHKEFSKCFLQTVNCSFVAKLTSIGICWRSYGISWRAYGADRFQFSHYSCFIVTKCQGHQHHFLFHQIGKSLTDLLCGRSKALITCVRNDRELFCHLHQSNPLPILEEEITIYILNDCGKQCAKSIYQRELTNLCGCYSHRPRQSAGS